MTVDLGGGAWIMNKYIDCFRIISKCEKKKILQLMIFLDNIIYKKHGERSQLQENMSYGNWIYMCSGRGIGLSYRI